MRSTYDHRKLEDFLRRSEGVVEGENPVLYLKAKGKINDFTHGFTFFLK